MVYGHGPYGHDPLGLSDHLIKLCRDDLIPIANSLKELGFSLIATIGTSEYLQRTGLDVRTVLKVHEGSPNVEDQIRSGKVQLVINTPIGRQAAHDDKYLRRAAVDYSVPILTTLAGARAAVEAITSLQKQVPTIAALQDIHINSRA